MRAMQARSRPNVGSRRRIPSDVYRTFIGHRGGFVCITDYNGTQVQTDATSGRFSVQ